MMDRQNLGAGSHEDFFLYRAIQYTPPGDKRNIRILAAHSASIRPRESSGPLGGGETEEGADVLGATRNYYPKLLPETREPKAGGAREAPSSR